MPKSTRKLKAIDSLATAQKSMIHTKADAASIKLKSDFDIKMLGQKESYQQDMFGYGQDMLSLVGTGAELYKDYSTLEKGREEYGKQEYKKEQDSLKKEYESPHKTFIGTWKDWDELSDAEKEDYKPTRDYGFDTTSKWGKIRKAFEDMGVFTGDIDPTYIKPDMSNEQIMGSSIKALSELKEGEKLKEMLGIDSGLTSTKPNIPDPLSKIQGISKKSVGKYLGTPDQKQKLLVALGGKKGGSLTEYLMQEGLSFKPSDIKKYWDIYVK